LRNGALNCGS